LKGEHVEERTMNLTRIGKLSVLK